MFYTFLKNVYELLFLVFEYFTICLMANLTQEFRILLCWYFKQRKVSLFETKLIFNVKPMLILVHFQLYNSWKTKKSFQLEVQKNKNFVSWIWISLKRNEIVKRETKETLVLGILNKLTKLWNFQIITFGIW